MESAIWMTQSLPYQKYENFPIFFIQNPALPIVIWFSCKFNLKKNIFKKTNIRPDVFLHIFPLKPTDMRPGERTASPARAGRPARRLQEGRKRPGRPAEQQDQQPEEATGTPPPTTSVLFRFF